MRGKYIFKYPDPMEEIDIFERVIRNIAHEVRNPLTTIKGYAQILSQKNDLAHIARSQNIIIEQAERINAIFTELYDAFTIVDEVKTECIFPHIVQSITNDSPYKKHINLGNNEEFKMYLNIQRLSDCIHTIVNGFNWQYFNDVSLDIVSEKKTDCYIYFNFSGVAFDNIFDDYFYFPFQSRQYFAHGTELFKVYCISKKIGWHFSINKNNNGFVIRIPL